MRKIVFYYWLICLCLFQSASAQLTFEPVKNPAKDDFSPIVQFLSAPELEGRMTGEPGNKIAAHYIAAFMQQLRLKPWNHPGTTALNTGHYFQKFNLYKNSHTNTFIVFQKVNQLDADTFLAYKDFYPEPFYSSFRISGTPFISFSEDTGRSKVVKSPKIELFDFEGSMMDNSKIGEFGESKKPGAVLQFHAASVQEEEEIPGILTGPFFSGIATADSPASNTFHFKKDASQKIIDTYIKGSTSNKKSRVLYPMKNLIIQVHGDIKTESLTTYNLIGILMGIDTTKSIIIGAHFDHLGKDEKGVYCGADDNASGVAGVLSLAKMWQESSVIPPCNLIFACWTAEEAGKLGSGFFADNLVSSEDILLYINMDMISRSAPEDTLNEILSIGHRAVDMSLKNLCVDVNARLAKPFNTDLWEVNEFGGSDYAPFVKKQVPVLTFFSGFHPDYHTPKDTFDNIDPDKMQRVLHYINEIIKGLFEF